MTVRMVDQLVEVHASSSEITHESNAVPLLETSAFEIRVIEDRLIGG
jgi:hypothetical protein